MKAKIAAAVMIAMWAYGAGDARGQAASDEAARPDSAQFCESIRSTWGTEAVGEDSGDGDVELFDYTVEAGDSCASIAEREFGDRRAYDKIHKHNPGMGPTPHRLVPGTVLKLPKKGRKLPDACLLNWRGLVFVLESFQQEWREALRRTDLYTAWRVGARERSSAFVRFRDSSSIVLRDDSVVIIYGETKSAARVQPAMASLERGALKARLAEIDGDPTLVVETPSSQSEVQSADALVRIDEEGTSLVANHKGKPVRVRSRRRGRRVGAEVPVSEGMGSKVVPGRAPTPPRPLPPAPRWHTGAKNFAGYATLGGAIWGAWDGVDQAVRYRVEIAADPERKEIVTSAEFDAQHTAFVVDDLPVGQYYVTVATIDSDGFESPPSAAERITLASLTLWAPGSVLAQAGDVEPEPYGGRPSSSETPRIGPREQNELPTRSVLQGSAIVASAGVRCHETDVGQPADNVSGEGQLRLDTLGRFAVHCKHTELGTLAPVQVDVRPLQARAQTPMGQALLPLPRQHARRVRLELSSTASNFAEMKDNLQIRPTNRKHAQVEDTEFKDCGKPHCSVALATVMVSDDAPEEVSFQVVAGPSASRGDSAADSADDRAAADAEEHATVLAQVSFKVLPPAPAVISLAPARYRRLPFGVHLGLFGGATLPGDNHELGPEVDGDSSLGPAALGGLRLGLDLHRRIAVELELWRAAGTLEGAGAGGEDLDTGVFGYRAHVRVPVMLGRLQPFVVAGAGVRVLPGRDMEITADSAGEGYYGLGLSLWLGERIALRVDGRHALAPANGDIGSTFDVFAGLTWQPIALPLAPPH